MGLDLLSYPQLNRFEGLQRRWVTVFVEDISDSIEMRLQLGFLLRGHGRYQMSR